MLSKKAVRKFLARKLDDFRPLKKVPRKVLREEVRELTKGSLFHFYTKPFKHQLVCFYIGVCLDRFLFFLDMGLGKTKIVLDILWYRRLVGEVKHTLVLVPEEQNVEGWEEEISKHSTMQAVPLYGSTKERFELLNEEGAIYIIPYSGMMHMVCTIKKNSKGQPKMRVSKKKVKEVASHFDALVIDECHNAKNHESVTYKMCNWLTEFIPIAYGLTGTPFGRNPADCWAQFHMIDKGETLGETLAVMRQAFFSSEMNPWTGFESNWKFDERHEKKFHRRLQHRSLRYSDDECADLPPRVEMVKHYGLSPDAMQHYANAVQGIIDAGGDKKKLENSFIKLRQICSGYLTYKPDDESSDFIPFEDNPKLNLLRTLVDGLPDKRKMLIFYEFNPSGDFLEEMAKDSGLGYAIARGKRFMKKRGTTTREQLRNFKEDPDCRLLVANWKVAAEGGNFQVANYLSFFESPVSPIKRRQCLKRVSRTGQTRRTYITDLVALTNAGSVEAKILEYLAEGKDLFHALLEGKQEFFE